MSIYTYIDFNNLTVIGVINLFTYSYYYSEYILYICDTYT